VPVEKRRIYKSSTRCGCPFKISFSFLDLKDRDNISVRLNGSSNFKHFFPKRLIRNENSKMKQLIRNENRSFEKRLPTIINFWRVNQRITILKNEDIKMCLRQPSRFGSIALLSRLKLFETPGSGPDACRNEIVVLRKPYL
jgi:hypothetical protein